MPNLSEQTFPYVEIPELRDVPFGLLQRLLQLSLALKPRISLIPSGCLSVQLLFLLGDVHCVDNFFV